MKTIECSLEGIIILEPNKYNDSRGFFQECFQKERYTQHGIKEEFVQDNHSRSYKNVLRGMHFTKKRNQAQLLTVIRGKIYDVVVDIRKESKTFGQWFGVELSEDGPTQIYMPFGFAHGFCVLSEVADLHYKVSEKYDSQDDHGINWADPDLQIKWPIENPIISEKDSKHRPLKELI